MRKSALIILLVLASPSLATDKYVSHSGDDQLGDGSAATPYRTIQKGVDNLVADSNCRLISDSPYISEALVDANNDNSGDWYSDTCTFVDDTVNFTAAGVEAGDNIFYDSNAYCISTVGGGWVSPTGHTEGNWADEAYAYDHDILSYASTIRYSSAWSEFLELTLSGSIPCNKVRFYLWLSSAVPLYQVDVDVYYNAAWEHVYEGTYEPEQWMEKSITGGLQSVSKARIRLRQDYPAATQAVCEFNLYKVDATILTCTAAPAGNPADVNYTVGDQELYPLILDNPDGNLAGNKWLGLTSDDANDRAMILRTAALNYVPMATIHNASNDVTCVVTSSAWKITNIDVNTVGIGFFVGVDANTNSVVFEDVNVAGAEKAFHLYGDIRGVSIRDCELYDLTMMGVYMHLTDGVVIDRCYIHDINGANAFGIRTSEDPGYEPRGTIVTNNSVDTIHVGGISAWGIAVGPGSTVANNTVYNVRRRTGSVYGIGIVLRGSATNKGAVTLYNNIIMDTVYGIQNRGVSVSYLGYNCIYDCDIAAYSGLLAQSTDVLADPKFMNAAGGDFRLKADSPCLNTGYPTLGGGYTDIGAWQRKSFLRIR